MSTPVQEQTNSVLRVCSIIGWWIYFPIWTLLWYLAVTCLLVAKLLYRPVAFILLPFVYLGRFLLAMLALPFRVAARFETLYIYLGIAAIIGLIGGICIRLVYYWLYHLLRLEAKPKAQFRTAKEYREEKRKQKAEAEVPLLPHPRSLPHAAPLSPSYFSLSDSARSDHRQRGSITQTILEEEYDSGF